MIRTVVNAYTPMTVPATLLFSGTGSIGVTGSIGSIGTAGAGPMSVPTGQFVERRESVKLQLF